jgi:hypothetical protein
MKLEILDKDMMIDFDDEIIRLKRSIKKLEFFLFENLDPVAAEILNQPTKQGREKLDQRRMTKINFNGFVLNLQSPPNETTIKSQSSKPGTAAFTKRSHSYKKLKNNMDSKASSPETANQSSAKKL